MSETREIKGEIEGWAQEARKFGKNNRGSRGLKIENNWHNVVGKVDELNILDQTFPHGTFVKFKEKQNARGYWDVDGQISKIEKEEAYQMGIDHAHPGAEKTVSTVLPKDMNTVKNFNQNKDNDITFAVAFKGAVKAIDIFYKSFEGIVDLDKVNKQIIAETGKLYMGLKEKKIQLQEAEEW